MVKMMTSMELKGLIHIYISSTTDIINSVIYYVIGHKGKKELTEHENSLEALRGLKTRLILKLGLLDTPKTPDNAKLSRIYKEVQEISNELDAIQKKVNKLLKRR